MYYDDDQSRTFISIAHCYERRDIQDVCSINLYIIIFFSFECIFIPACTGFIPKVHNKVHPITQFYISKKRKLLDTEIYIFII